MFDNSQMLDLLERALEADPFCSVCSAPTTIDADELGLWLVCPTTTDNSTVIERLNAAIMPHDRRLIVDQSEALAA
jgi:hypothetical protein